MTVFRKTIKVADLQKQVGALLKLQKKVMREVNEKAARAAVQELQRRTDDAPPAAPHGTHIGALWRRRVRNSWFALPMVDGIGVVVGNKAFYAPYIEYGRKPGGMLPYSISLRLWVHDKWGIPDGPALERATFRVARNIQKRGLLSRKITFRSRHVIRIAARNALLDCTGKTMRAVFG